MATVSRPTRIEAEAAFLEGGWQRTSGAFFSGGEAISATDTLARSPSCSTRSTTASCRSSAGRTRPRGARDAGGLLAGARRQGAGVRQHLCAGTLRVPPGARHPHRPDGGAACRHHRHRRHGEHRGERLARLFRDIRDGAAARRWRSNVRQQCFRSAWVPIPRSLSMVRSISCSTISSRTT